jgi:hypothetical protein
MGLLVLVVSMFTAGLDGLLMASPLWLAFLTIAFLRWRGEAIADALPTVLHWNVRVARKQTRFRAKTLAPRPTGTMALPGDAASLRFHRDSTGAAMVHDPHRQTLSAVVRVSHPAYVLLSKDDQARRVSAWSRVLAALSASGSSAGLQILESTLPDPGQGVRDWYVEHGTHDDGWTSKQYEILMDQTAPTSYRHRTLVVLSLDLRRAAKAIRNAGRGIRGAAEVLRGDMSTLVGSLRAADLHIEGWLGTTELANVIRESYDPGTDMTGRNTELAAAGPVAIDEHWDHLRHDSAYSAVLWISEWPRIDVSPHFLHSLVFLQHVRKTISITVKPLGTNEALRAIRKEKVEYLTEAQQNARIGKIADFSSEQEYEDVLARERALVSGHADLRFSGFITVTANSRDELMAAVASAERGATQCGCETRLLFGQQSQAFVAGALPLGRAVH